MQKYKSFSKVKLKMKFYKTPSFFSKEKPGKHKTGLGCHYINKLEDVDLNVLQDMIETSLMI